MKPILFNTEMVKAILKGIKTQTRRLIKEAESSYKFVGWCTDTTGNTNKVGCALFKDNSTVVYIKPKYKIGDILYVRETWSTHRTVESKGELMYCYKADDIDLKTECLEGENNRWYPSIHMPKEASRLFLKVTDVRVEKLQDITTYGCINEGILTLEEYHEYDYDPFQPIASFILFGDLWNSTVDKKERDKYGWNANPWIFVYEFKVISKEEAHKDARN